MNLLEKSRPGKSWVNCMNLSWISGVHIGEVKLGFCLSKGTLEVEVICAKDICPGEKEEPGNLCLLFIQIF